MEGDCFDLPLFASSFFYLIYKLSCILKQKLFWKEKKTNWRKMSKKTSKSFKPRHSFPNGCDIFQQEKAWSWHFPESFNCDTFCGGRENNFPSQILTDLYRVLFTMGFPLIWELAAMFRAVQTAGATRSFLTGWDLPGFQKDFSNKNSTGSTLSSPACPSTQPGWGWPSFLRWEKIFYCLQSRQRKSILCSVWFHWLAAKQPKPQKG